MLLLDIPGLRYDWIRVWYPYEHDEAAFRLAVEKAEEAYRFEAIQQLIAESKAGR